MPRVINRKEIVRGGKYSYDMMVIDRTTSWGNPFIIGVDGDRSNVCDAYKVWLWEWLMNGKEIKYTIGARTFSNKWVIEHMKELKGKDLVCWCAPAECHGDYLMSLANMEYGGENEFNKKGMDNRS